MSDVSIAHAFEVHHFHEYETQGHVTTSNVFWGLVWAAETDGTNLTDTITLYNTMAWRAYQVIVKKSDSKNVTVSGQYQTRC